LNRLYATTPALHAGDCDPAGFAWVDCNDAASSVLCLVRQGRSDPTTVLVACNFTPLPRLRYRVGVPYGGVWREVLNSDAQAYEGQGFGNMGAVEAGPIAHHGRPCSLELTLPPLGIVFFISPEA
jgi:1,4-alpha-glucan branching enzyme